MRWRSRKFWDWDLNSERGSVDNYSLASLTKANVLTIPDTCVLSRPEACCHVMLPLSVMAAGDGLLFLAPLGLIRSYCTGNKYVSTPPCRGSA